MGVVPSPFLGWGLRPVGNCRPGVSGAVCVQVHDCSLRGRPAIRIRRQDRYEEVEAMVELAEGVTGSDEVN